MEFSMFRDAPTREALIADALPNPLPLKGHLHMFKRVIRAKSKLALSVRASFHALASKVVPCNEESIQERRLDPLARLSARSC